MPYDVHKSAFLGIRVDVTVYTKKVFDGRQLCSGLDLLHLESIESVPGGSFDTKGASVDIFLKSCRLRFEALAQEICKRNAYASSIRVWSALTFARQAIGWSGKYIHRQLREARNWTKAQARQEAKRDIQSFYMMVGSKMIHKTVS